MAGASDYSVSVLLCTDNPAYLLCLIGCRAFPCTLDNTAVFVIWRHFSKDLFSSLIEMKITDPVVLIAVS